MAHAKETASIAIGTEPDFIRSSTPAKHGRINRLLVEGIHPQEFRRHRPSDVLNRFPDSLAQIIFWDLDLLTPRLRVFP